MILCDSTMSKLVLPAGYCPSWTALTQPTPVYNLPMSSTDTTTEALAGSIERVTFHNPDNPLDCDLVLVDEVSMMDLPLATRRPV